jgi:MHS family proline/betaine transporter-like MFS transporter
MGNIFEWYDFSLYGYLAPLISRLFFPEITQSTGLVITFAIFATGFITRPLGSMVLGHYGDRLGRKVALTISVLLMASSTCLIGLLPTHQSIGIMAGVLLTICRLIQGFAIGGEFTISVTYIIEHAPTNRKSFYGSLTMLGNFLGLFLGSITIALLELVFSSHELISYGWRLPFIFSVILGLIGLFMRITLPETPEFIALVKNKVIETNPIFIIMRKQYLKTLAAVGIVCLGASSFTLWFVWLPSYLKMYSSIPASHILLINSLNILAIVFAIPIVGILADKINYRSILYFAASVTILCIIPLLSLMNQLTLPLIWGAQMILAILASCAYGVVPITLFNLFPTSIRCSGISVAYNLANMLFGGTIPLIASIILTKSSNLMYQGIIIILAALIMLISLPMLSKLNRPKQNWVS